MQKIGCREAIKGTVEPRRRTAALLHHVHDTIAFRPVALTKYLRSYVVLDNYVIYGMSAC